MKLRCPRACAALCAAVITACGGDSWELDVDVRVTAAVQKDYTGGYPAQLVLLLDNAAPTDPARSGGKAYRIANLCAAGSENLVFNAKLSHSECDAPLYVRAWLEARDPDAESKCGGIAPPTELEGIRKAPSNAPRAEGSPFSDSCGAEGHPVTLALAFKRLP